MSYARAQLALANGNYTVDRDFTVQLRQEGSGFYASTQLIRHTGVEVVTMRNTPWFDDPGGTGPVAVEYYMWIRNLDPTNYVKLGREDDSGTLRAMARLEPNEFAIFPLDDAQVLKAQADTASVEIELLVIER